MSKDTDDWVVIKIPLWKRIWWKLLAIPNRLRGRYPWS